MDDQNNIKDAKAELMKIKDKINELITYGKKELKRKGFITEEEGEKCVSLLSILNFIKEKIKPVGRLNTPILSLMGNILKIDDSNNGKFTEKFCIYIDDKLKKEINKENYQEINLADLSVQGGTHKVKVKCVADNMLDGLEEINWHLNVSINSCLTFSSEAEKSFSLKTENKGKNWNGILEYSTNLLKWTEWLGEEINSNNGKIYLRGINNTYITNRSSNNKFVFNGSSTKIQCDGNIENLLDYTKVANGEHPTMEDYCYHSLFKDCTSLITSPSLSATTLVKGCYDSMFSGCTSLTTLPELPATTLAEYCYYYMFENCTSLSNIVSLPALELKDYCYCSMFKGCTSLEEPPALPATTLAIGCYQSMFEGCTSLTTVVHLYAVVLKEYCYNSMFKGCSDLKYDITNFYDDSPYFWSICSTKVLDGTYLILATVDGWTENCTREMLEENSCETPGNYYLFNVKPVGKLENEIIG